MKKITLLFLIINVFAQAQRFDWVSTAGFSGVANSFSEAIPTVRDSQGNIYMLNGANGQQICQGVTAEPFSGTTTAFLYKFNAAGVLQNIKRIGFIPLNLQIGENDNVYVLGSLSGINSLKIETETFVGVANRNYIIKFGATGNLIWTAFNNSSGPLSASPMLQFSNNHIYFQSGHLSISKLNTDGQYVATLTATSFVPATANVGVSFKGSGVLSNGDIIFSAESRGTITFGTTTLTPTGNQFLETAALTIRTTENLSFVWANYTNGLRSPDKNQIPMTVGNDNGIYMGVQVISSLTAGTDTITNTGSSIGFGGILKMDAAGNKIWLKSTSERVQTWALLNNPDGSGVFCAGEVFGIPTLALGSTTLNPANGPSFVSKIDYNGVFQNSFTFGSVSGAFAKSLATNNQGVFYVSGRLNSTSNPIFSCIAREGHIGSYLGTFTEQPDRAPTPTINVSGNTLTASPAFTGTIQWFLNGVAISGANSQTLTISQTGNYTVTYVLSDYNACTSTSSVIMISNLATTDFENSTNSIKVFPNPTTGIITISNIDNLKIDKIEILDILGKTVATKAENTSQIDISNVANGIYIFKIYSGETVFQQKIIKQ